MRDPGTWLYPLPVVLVTCQGRGTQPNIITAAWAGTVCSEPPMISVSVQPRRYSHGLIKERREFVVNIPTASQAEEVDYCGLVSGRDVDKFEACGFTPEESRRVSVPGIKECPVQLECKVHSIQTLGVHDLFIGEIQAVVHDPAVIANGRIDPKAADPLIYVMGQYLNMDSVIGWQGMSRRRGDTQ